MSLLQLLVRAPCATPWRPARTHEPAAADPTRFRVAQLAVKGRDHLGENIFHAAAVNAGIPQERYKNIYASVLLEPKDNSQTFSARSAHVQPAFPPSMRQKLANVPMTGARLRRAALPPAT